MSPRAAQAGLGSGSGYTHGMTEDRRPRFLDLRRIALPVTALVSILHRLSGVLLFLTLPLLLFMLERSLASAQGFDELLGLFDSNLARLALLPLLWALSHHLLAGLRVLLLDVDVGVDIRAARLSARSVSLAAPLLALILWGVLL